MFVRLQIRSAFHPKGKMDETRKSLNLHSSNQSTTLLKHQPCVKVALRILRNLWKFGNLTSRSSLVTDQPGPAFWLCEFPFSHRNATAASRRRMRILIDRTSEMFRLGLIVFRELEGGMQIWAAVLRPFSKMWWIIKSDRTPLRPQRIQQSNNEDKPKRKDQSQHKTKQNKTKQNKTKQNEKQYFILTKFGRNQGKNLLQWSGQKCFRFNSP
jgi:hypothetical protein